MKKSEIPTINQYEIAKFINSSVKKLGPNKFISLIDAIVDNFTEKLNQIEPHNFTVTGKTVNDGNVTITDGTPENNVIFNLRELRVASHMASDNFTLPVVSENNLITSYDEYIALSMYLKTLLVVDEGRRHRRQLLKYYDDVNLILCALNEA